MTKKSRLKSLLLLSALLPVACFAGNPSVPDDPPPDGAPSDKHPVDPSEMGADLGFGAVAEVGEDYILFVDEDGHEQEVLKGWPDPPPKEPPVAQIVGIDETGKESFAEGILHNTTWPHIDDPPDSWAEGYIPTIAVPDAIGVNRRTVRLLTKSVPMFVDVAGFKEPRIPGKVYSAEEVTDRRNYEYIRSHRNPGERVSEDGYIEYYQIPSEVLGCPYIRVSVRWNMPPPLKDGKMVISEDYIQPPNAHWLFYIADK